MKTNFLPSFNDSIPFSDENAGMLLSNNNRIIRKITILLNLLIYPVAIISI
jgi:hypothetical protein